MPLRVITLSLLMGAALNASPILTWDWVAVSHDDPGLGRAIVAEPGSTWEAWFNDNWGGGDYDFNDLVLRISFGLSSAEVEVIGARALATNVANLGAVTVDRFDIGPKSFAYVAGTELILAASNITMGGGPYYSGAASRNPDNTIHWWVQQIDGALPPPDSPTQEPGSGQLQAVPEPGTFGMLGCVLPLLGAYLWRRPRR